MPESSHFASTSEALCRIATEPRFAVGAAECELRKHGYWLQLLRNVGSSKIAPLFIMKALIKPPGGKEMLKSQCGRLNFL